MKSITDLSLINPESSVFVYLREENPTWWQLIKSDNSIYIDVRKDNTIDVYYNGGSFMSGIKISRGILSWKTHYKYLVNSDDSTNYISSETKELPVMKNLTSSLTLVALDKLKRNIRTFYPSASEKGVQGAFVTQDHSCFIDTEFAFTENEHKDRIDMVWVDVAKSKILFVELKLPENSELYDFSRERNIKNQLSRYTTLIKKHKLEIESYYKKIFSIKKYLGILPNKLQSIDNIDNFVLETKPLLAVGNCNQKWINSQAPLINEQIKDVAIGAYYFGSSGNCDVIPKSIRNKFVFL